MRTRKRRALSTSMDVSIETPTGMTRMRRWLGKSTNAEVYQAAIDLLVACAPRCVEFRGPDGAVEEVVYLSKLGEKLNRKTKQPVSKLPKGWEPPDGRSYMPIVHTGRGLVLTLNPHCSDQFRDMQQLLGERTKAKVLKIALDWLQRCARATMEGRQIHLIHADGHRECLRLGAER